MIKVNNPWFELLTSCCASKHQLQLWSSAMAAMAMENILVADYLPPEEIIHKTSHKVRLDYASVHVLLIDDFDHVFIYIPTNYDTDPKFAHVHTR